MKLYAYIAAAILLASVVGYGVHVVRKANRVDVAEARAVAAEQGRHADMAEITKRLDRDATQRQALLDRMGDIEKQFGDIKIPPAEALVNNREVPSVQGKCNVASLSSTFIELFNKASASP